MSVDYFKQISYLVLEPNSGCNLRCGSCNRESLVQAGLRPPKVLTLPELDHILNQLADCPINTVKLQYLSEPMLYPQLPRVAQRLRQAFPQALMMTATNLQYDVQRAPFAQTLDFLDMMYLSIDGIGDTYEAARTGGKYSKLLASLRQINEMIPAEIRQKKLHINFTLTPDNFRDLEGIYQLKNEFGLAAVRINLAQNWTENELNQRRFGPEIIEFLKPYKMDVKGVGGWQYQECYWPFSGVVIDVYGDVRQCTINTTQASLGNVYHTPLKQIFNHSPVLQEVRSCLSKNTAAASCRTCDYNYLSPILQEIFGGSHLVNQPRKVL